MTLTSARPHPNQNVGSGWGRNDIDCPPEWTFGILTVPGRSAIGQTMELACLGFGYLYFLALNQCIRCIYCCSRTILREKGQKESRLGAAVRAIDGMYKSKPFRIYLAKFLAPFCMIILVTCGLGYSKVVSALNMNCRFLLPAHWVEDLTLSS